jgi:MFS family permease
LAMAGMFVFSGDIRSVLWIAVVPAFISVFILCVAVKEPPIKDARIAGTPIKIKDIFKIGSAYWQIVAIAGVFTLARFSNAFLLLKARDIGISAAFVPLVIVVMNIFYASTAYPAGALSDTVKRKNVVLMGIFFLIMADIILGFANNVWMLGAGTIFWGMHLAFVKGSLSTLVTDTTSPELRGTAYGIFNFVSGIAMLASSIIAGLLWDWYGPSVTFFTGAAFTTIAFIGFLIIETHQKNNG